MTNYFSRYISPLGGITLGSDGEALTGLWFEGQKRFGATLSGNAEEADLPVFCETRRWLGRYFHGEIPDFTPALSLRGTAFQLEVWALLQKIPYGETTTYGALAAALAAKQGLPSMSAQAVGNAVGRNPVSLIVPCHRVVGANGAMIGYAGGIEKKIALLRLEQAGADVKNRSDK